MRLSTFIRDNRLAIVHDWEAFAHTLKPAARMTKLQLTNHIDAILDFLADDIETGQLASEQFAKSQGRQPDQSPDVDTAAQTHADRRQSEGYNVVEMVSEYRALRATITRLWLQTNPLFDEQHASDLVRFSEAIDQSLAESVLRFTQTVDQAKDLLLGVLGHDIRSPVGVVQMAVSLIPKCGPINARQAEILEQVGVSAYRVQQIVADLLDMAKSQNGQSIPLTKQDFVLSDLCGRIVDECRIRHPDREFRLEIAEHVTGHWDEIRLGQVLTNLLNNAVQYSPENTPVCLMLSAGAKEVTFSVTNVGDPIPKTYLDSIFNSFSRGPASTHETVTSNLGLGLYISKKIVSAHGGHIDVASSLNEGTTFTVRLPNRVDVAGAPSAPSGT